MRGEGSRKIIMSFPRRRESKNMEKIIHPIRKTYYPIKFYLDDLEKIVEILKEENFLEIVIKTKKNKYNNTEIAQMGAGETIDEISSRNGDLYISINFDNNFDGKNSIYINKDFALAEGIIQKIGNILLSRKRKVFSVISSNWFLPVICVFTSVFIGLLNIEKIINDKQGALFFLINLIFVIIIMVCVAKFSKGNIFYYKRKNNLHNFFIRNKDQIWIVIISSILGAVITLVVTRLL
jgi:hypothetical protein